MKTLLHTPSDFSYDTTLIAQSNAQIILNSINFDTIEPDHMIKLEPIIKQGVDIEVYTRYIKSILNKNDVLLNSILMNIWTHLGSKVLTLPILIHEKCIEVYPVIFEKTILSAILLWQIDDLIAMCSKSPLVFQTCSSIFNTLLIKLDFTDKFMNFIIHFLNSVSSQCNNNNIDIIDIYPIKCRNVLILRAIKNQNSTKISKHNLNEEVKKLFSKYPKECMCLVSHFSDLYVPN